MRNENPFDVLYDILIAEKCQATMLDTIASEEDMLRFLKDPYSNLISDATYPTGGKYHPRVYAAFPKVLTDYVRDRHVFSIEEAVYKMTGRAARPLHLDRGVLDKGRTADINVFRWRIFRPLRIFRIRRGSAQASTMSWWAGRSR